MPPELRTFRIPRDDRPPTPFRLTFEVPEVEKVQTEGPDGEPVWEERETGRWVEEVRTFHARHRLPAGLVLSAGDVDPTDPASGARQAAAVRQVLRLAVVEAEEFLSLLDDERTVVDPATLGEVVNWLIELAAARPTNTPPR